MSRALCASLVSRAGFARNINKHTTRGCNPRRATQRARCAGRRLRAECRSEPSRPASTPRRTLVRALSVDDRVCERAAAELLTIEAEIACSVEPSDNGLPAFLMRSNRNISMFRRTTFSTDVDLAGSGHRPRGVLLCARPYRLLEKRDVR